MVAIKVDAKRRVLWATEVAFNGFAHVPAADWGRSVLLEYDLDRGTLLAPYSTIPTGLAGPASGLSSITIMHSAAQASSAAAAANT